MRFFSKAYYLFLTLSAVSISFLSCKKEPRGNTGTTNSTIYGNWGLTNEVEEMYISNNLIESNTYDYNSDDETVEFKSNGVVNFYEEGLLTQTYDFSYANNQIIIFDDTDPLYNDTMNVKSVSSEKLVLVQKWDEPSIGELFISTLTFVRK
mgnify:CR=1 FL=1